MELDEWVRAQHTCRDSRAQGRGLGELLVPHLQLPAEQEGPQLCNLTKAWVVLPTPLQVR